MSYDCPTHQQKLLAIGLNIHNDNTSIHPGRFCHSCYNTTLRSIKAKASGKDYTPHLTKFDWVEHSEISCSVCEQLGGVKRGRKKKISRGRPSGQLLGLVAHIKERAPPSQLDTTVREMLSLDAATDEDLKCPLCHLVVDRSVLIVTCNKLVCMSCCVEHILYQHTDLTCPSCGNSHTLTTTTVVSAPTVVVKLLGGMEVTCEKCSRPVQAGT